MAIERAKAGIAKIRPHMLSAESTKLPPASVLLDSNENALGPSFNALAAARGAVARLNRYTNNPDQELAGPIANYFGLDASRITIGQGSDDLLARLARGYLGPGCELIRSQNGYLKVPNYAHANDAETVSVADDNFVPSVDRMIEAITEKTRMVYLANPENPAGTYLSGAEVRRLHAALPESVLLVIDAAYEEYVDAPDYEPAQKLVDEAENVVMCRTFSKIFGLAGARVGWLYGPPDIVDTVRRIALTFPVSSPSLAAAQAALEDHEHTQMACKANKLGRDWLTARITKLGLNVIPSQANFILVGFPDPQYTAAKAHHFLRLRGIATRRFAAPAYNDFIRITIGREKELQIAETALGEFLNGASQ